MSAFEKENNDNTMDVVREGSTNSKISDGARSQLPWVEKYRPNSLQDLIAHEEIISILNKLIESNKLPHLLFHGPPGNLFMDTFIHLVMEVDRLFIHSFNHSLFLSPILDSTNLRC